MYKSLERTMTTERLMLRPFELSDAQRVFEYCNNYNLYKSTLNLPYPYSLECALSWIKTHEENFIHNLFYEFAVADRITNELYGAIGISHNQQYRLGELGYWMGEEHWGNGYATEAARAVLDFAFQEKNYNKVYARYFATNIGSGRVMEKIGMVREGVLLEHIYKEDRFEDLVHYGILAPKI
ncbi:RimJ/RimL family protein N-acetyltransferase [Paenibacillus shirakamiensis]|uniref:RimJ/RimL family protein N-acetyltransferase n=1 Tax=Paenibacillus shirakamiensis TaxID=1265935 RepID=A0ABS4JDX3_9BACL|nr:GNAT family N-acetyltransferase [Paenibacillus shirakamiensis]MBP1999922.1 RimJ/RimL family protein N-acetyltransferase [Paenibacillus shirakamiensis]